MAAQAIPSQSRIYEKMIVHSVLFVCSSISASVSPALISDLDSKVRLDLQQTSDWFFFWVAFSAIVVAFGCLLEGPEILHEIFPNLFSWLTWPSKNHLDKFERRIKKIGLIGWLLVVLGVAAEGVFEVYDHQASGLLQTFDEVLLTDAQRNAGSAADAARRANTAASEAESVADAAGIAAGKAPEDRRCCGQESRGYQPIPGDDPILNLGPNDT